MVSVALISLESPPPSTGGEQHFGFLLDSALSRQSVSLFWSRNAPSSSAKPTGGSTGWVLPCSLLVSLCSFSLFLKRDLQNMDGEQTVRIPCLNKHDLQANKDLRQTSSPSSCCRSSSSAVLVPGSGISRRPDSRPFSVSAYSLSEGDVLGLCAWLL
jgi:hypothetical protein